MSDTTEVDGMKRQRRKIPVWEKLAAAYARKSGLRLSPHDVDTLMLMDTATRDAVRDYMEKQKTETTK